MIMIAPANRLETVPGNRKGKLMGEAQNSDFFITPAIIARIVLKLSVIIGALAGLLFLPAGRLDWLEAWLFVVAYGLFLAFYGLWASVKDPDQLHERQQVAENVKQWDKVIMAVYTLLLLVLFPLAGLDAGRFGWSSVPLAITLLGWLGFVAAGSLIFWTLATNTYLSRMARIQHDRRQRVVTSGPYQHVRHPMYTGNVLLFLCVPLVLGSWWAGIPGLLIGALYVLRTCLEDRMLRQELEGYSDYAQRVRYRLLPGIW
jgi:protein-S-isoprenylcysteine O-methyltransferase Ste14